jgi:MerR family transcriptional regulator/heat shock protein HspR
MRTVLGPHAAFWHPDVGSDRLPVPDLLSTGSGVVDEVVAVMDANLPVYIISSAADMLGIHPRTLHMYEEKGLVVAARKGNRRFYSANDMDWIRAIRYLVRERGLNLEGLRRVLALRALGEYGKASAERQEQCGGFVGRVVPCWQSNPTRSDCYACCVYVGAREGLCVDEGVPSRPL